MYCQRKIRETNGIDSMEGYKLRYYKEYGLHKAIVRIEILKKYDDVNFAPAPIEIGGVLAGARLIMQGDQDDITTPIVKTSLELSLVDAPGTEYGRMTGPWEEFFTPDSTGYIVKLYIDNVLEWSGYITPDSYEEDITTYGTVSIIARDNIGHLQDFMFEEKGDGEGMISVMSIFEKAWHLIQSQLQLDIPLLDDEIVWPECEGYRPIACQLNVEAFKDKNWYDVLEAVLDSFGLALRYVGNNTCRIYPLRNLSILDKKSSIDVAMRDAIFQATGHRTLQRACKAIVDKGKYESESDVSFALVEDSEYTGEMQTYRCKVVTLDVAGIPILAEHDAPVWPIKNKVGGRGWMDSDHTLFFDYTQYPDRFGKVKDENVMYIAANNVDTNRRATFSRRVSCKDMSIKMQFDTAVGLDARNSVPQIRSYGEMLLMLVMWYSLRYEVGSKVYYYDGAEWVESAHQLSKQLGDTASPNPEVVIDVPLQVLADDADEAIASGILYFDILRIEYYPTVAELRVANTGVYARLKTFTIAIPETETIDKTFDVKVDYDASNNNLIERSSELIAPLKTYPLQKNVINGIYLPENANPPARPWYWPGESSDVKTELQVLVAQQILLYNSKPNNILTGSLVAEGEIMRFPVLWRYGNRNHILVSGTMDLLTGYLEDVKLMEYKEWKDLYPDDYYFVTEFNEQVMTEDNNNVIIGD